ncbi:MAG TPA: glycosyltransferase family 39 protein [Ktedonobacteraceae bacterium]|nr:glycosyltransferase family 39 protein [Ktedonobacteraceae bacterium]
MIDTTATSTTKQSEQQAEKQQPPSVHLWQRIALGFIMLVSIFFNFYQLGQNGFANLYYAAGARSMADNLANFFFVSFDPGGFVTLDKPPLGFWLQAISVKIFGFVPFSVFLPQAIAGVLAVLVLYVLVRRHFGVIAGLLAALALAVSPISVVTNRNNTIDSTLALTMLLGAWAIMRAAETGKWRWLLLCSLSVGLGFNIKMLEAYLVVPAFGLLYLLAAPRSIWMRIGQLIVALAVMLVISLSWAVIVDYIPATQRPYVGSSQDNSEISLAIGYNGAQRLLGQNIGNGDNFPGNGNFPRRGNNNFPDFPGNTGNNNFPNFFGNDNGLPDGLGNGGGGGIFNTGSMGPLRLFNEPLGGQIAWLLPIALLGIVAVAWQRRPRFREDRQQQSLILWGTWLITMGIFFSIASFFHQYYLTVLAPAICALFGIGIAVMWQDYQQAGWKNWRGWLLPLALLATALEQIHIINSNPDWGYWLIPLILIPCGIVALALSVARLLPWFSRHARMLIPALCIGLLALLLTPTIWSAIPALQNQVADLPMAGPDQQGRFAGFGGSSTTDPRLISYLEANRGTTKYLVATPSSNSADAIILATNQPVMALGGFSGGDPILTSSQLQALVANGTVRFFLLDGRGGGRQSSQAALTGWVEQSCQAVSTDLWQSSSTSGGFGGFNGISALYDCSASK